MSESPAQLLGDLRQLRRKVRHDRRGYAFPLLMFAGLIMVAPVFYWSDWGRQVPLEGVPVRAEPGPFPVFESPWVWWGGDNLVIQWYWMLGLIACFAASAWWYRRRARLVGIETDTRTFLLTAGAALVGMVFGEPLLGKVIRRTMDTSLYSRPEINLPIMIGAVALSAVAVFVGARWVRVRVVCVFVATLFAMVAFSTLAVYLVNGLAALLIIAGAVLALAWVERSVFLGGIGVLFAGFSLHANLQGMSRYFDGSSSQINTLMDVAPPTAVLIVGGVLALVRTRRAAR